MKFWLAYKFRGSDFAELRSQLEEIKTLMEAKGHQVITMINDIQNWNYDPKVMAKAIAVKKAYELCKTCDAALCIYSTIDPSEGRGWDAGYFAGLGKPTIMAIHQDHSSPYTEALFSENPANKAMNLPSVIRFKTYSDIADSLSDI